jgi:hypothetical protein
VAQVSAVGAEISRALGDDTQVRPPSVVASTNPVGVDAPDGAAGNCSPARTQAVAVGQSSRAIVSLDGRGDEDQLCPPLVVASKVLGWALMPYCGPMPRAYATADVLAKAKQLVADGHEMVCKNPTPAGNGV